MNAVNTIKFHQDGSISGHNTDVYGFEKSLLEIINKTPKKALILGTGGAASAVAYVMRKLKSNFPTSQEERRKFNQLRSCG